ncbi:hypothetical protein [Thalassotalea euphylliae]|uniref:Uncharacterized protein n=1 Tax=Thalassotalea euphylliae TaxID=1655234 RepID=A0A3E0U397_9GAMM|nr:hypothetical protein [Thalassotalea euphylliae]REL31067.1 hypothetical protein DXX94_10270 [Thalassotalea euphylliae]
MVYAGAFKLQVDKLKHDALTKSLLTSQNAFGQLLGMRAAILFITGEERENDCFKYADDAIDEVVNHG